jgi:phytoene dehydrogenase-like protein
VRAEDGFDAVVVGAGIAGLSAACHLARAGRRVALLEAGEAAGGLCRTVRIGGAKWELSLYGLRGEAEGGPLAELLEGLGLAGELSFRRFPRACVVRIAGRELPIGRDREETLSAAERIEPGGAAKLRGLLERIDAFRPARDYAALGGSVFAGAAAGLGPLLRAAVSAPLFVGLGLPPERASAWFSFLKYRLLLSGGVSLPEGGAEALSGAFLRRFLADGGTFVPGARVDSVRPSPDGGGLASSGGRSWRGRALVLAVDATTSLGWLAGRLPPGFLRKAEALRPSLPATVLFCEASPSFAQGVGLDRAPQSILLGTADLSGHYALLRRGGTPSREEVAGFASSPPEPEPAGAGIRPVSAFLPSPAGPDGGRDAGVDPAGRLHAVPELPAGAVRVAGAWTPGDFRRRTGNAGGAWCGWEMGPERYGRMRIPQRLPLAGVWLAGHWTDPGPSVLNAAMSGRAAAAGILSGSG